MKYLVFFLCFFIVFNVSYGQIIPSNCNSSIELLDQYTWDVRNLTLRRMWELNSPDTAMVAIPQLWQDTIMDGIAAICNAASIPERDSVFNFYCVHDLASSGIFITKEIMVFVDTNYSWTDAWQNLISLTGNPQIDTIVTKYDLEVVDFYNFSFGNMALLASDSLWNVYALIDSLEMIPGVEYGDPNQQIGAAGRIIYDKSGTERYYTFWFQWNDCFDGCDNTHAWKFQVYEDCSVEYLGFEDWGVFGILPLPDPVNCNLFSSIPDEKPLMNLIKIYPNPADHNLVIASRLNDNYHLALYNFNGVVLLNLEYTNSVNIDITSFPQGIYFIRLTNENGETYIQKFIKK
jgi:hypothetical protein